MFRHNLLYIKNHKPENTGLNIRVYSDLSQNLPLALNESKTSQSSLKPLTKDHDKPLMAAIMITFISQSQ